MSDWEYKMQAIVNETMNENVTSLAGVPSWMLVLLNNVLETSGNKTILDVWPNLEVYFHGGVSFLPYVDQFKSIIPSKSVKYYEIYNASEGFFAIQDKNDSRDLLLMLDYGIFYEFIPMDSYGSEEESVIPLSEVELNKNYAIIVTTNGGLWRYKIGDTIRFTSLSPYRIRVSGRTKHHINVFGEELIIENANVNMSKRQADVAVRPTRTPPETLVGRRISNLAFAAYASATYMQGRTVNLAEFDWVRLDDSLLHLAADQWFRRTLPNAKSALTTNSVLGLLLGCEADLGATVIPCFMADTNHKLQRIVPPIDDAASILWLLTHEDLRHTARVRAFMDFIADALRADIDLLEGRVRKLALTEAQKT